jgi:hypothetical protein
MNSLPIWCSPSIFKYTTVRTTLCHHIFNDGCSVYFIRLYMSIYATTVALSLQNCKTMSFISSYHKSFNKNTNYCVLICWNNNRNKLRKNYTVIFACVYIHISTGLSPHLCTYAICSYLFSSSFLLLLIWTSHKIASRPLYMSINGNLLLCLIKKIWLGRHWEKIGARIKRDRNI